MWYLFKHGPEAGKGLVGKLGKSDIENFARCLNQRIIVLGIIRVKASQFIMRVLKRRTVVKLLAIVKMKPVPRIKRHEIEMVFSLFTK